ncbi:NERD domain-containing protein [Thaumasiovibrio subtropicus]|uniref:NERD domain-containing protein n=1 Tax=Thaumasiovibrio subtropicus TaxID=1891207 RepID=UPI000B360B9C|nr:NERD domain-containing protein [Thaumasiovibrio subtropicus]
MELGLWLLISPIAVLLAYLIKQPSAQLYHAAKQRYFLLKIHLYARRTHGALLKTVSIRNAPDCIDYVIINNQGLFCFSYHQWQGKLFGDLRAPQLTIKTGRKTYRFDNPVFQWHYISNAVKGVLPHRQHISIYHLPFFINARPISLQSEFYFSIKQLMTYISTRPTQLNHYDVAVCLEAIYQHCRVEKAWLSKQLKIEGIRNDKRSHDCRLP